MGMLATKKDDSDLAEALFLEAVLVLDRLPEARQSSTIGLDGALYGDGAVGVRVHPPLIPGEILYDFFFHHFLLIFEKKHSLGCFFLFFKLSYLWGCFWCFYILICIY